MYYNPKIQPGQSFFYKGKKQPPKTPQVRQIAARWARWLMELKIKNEELEIDVSAKPTNLNLFVEQIQ